MRTVEKYCQDEGGKERLSTITGNKIKWKFKIKYNMKTVTSLTFHYKVIHKSSLHVDGLTSYMIYQKVPKEMVGDEDID